MLTEESKDITEPEKYSDPYVTRTVLMFKANYKKLLGYIVFIPPPPPPNIKDFPLTHFTKKRKQYKRREKGKGKERNNEKTN
jgi:hypothetical protein